VDAVIKVLMVESKQSLGCLVGYHAARDQIWSSLPLKYYLLATEGEIYHG
jgi:hypothetical protein